MMAVVVANALGDRGAPALAAFAWGFVCVNARTRPPWRSLWLPGMGLV